MRCCRGNSRAAGEDGREKLGKMGRGGEKAWGSIKHGSVYMGTWKQRAPCLRAADEDKTNESEVSPHGRVPPIRITQAKKQCNCN